MKVQDYKTHSRLVPGYHFITFLLLTAVLIGSIVNLFHSTSGNIYSASLLVVLTVATILIAWYTRTFALRAQDRAIRAEENFRHYLATGKPHDSRLKIGQVIALRFAGDDEFVALSKRAADEQLSQKEIKLAIRNWRGDYNRV
jgi:hypothetical protein